MGNRGFFPNLLANSGREEVIAVLQNTGMDVVALSAQESRCGAVTTRQDVHRCVELFKKNRDRIDGIVVTLPNFGEERAIADTLRLANLQVPVLVQATPDDAKKMTIAFRRDSFCGKMSACNNLKQYGIPYSVTSLHTESPDSPEFAKDLQWFAGVFLRFWLRARLIRLRKLRSICALLTWSTCRIRQSSQCTKYSILCTRSYTLLSERQEVGRCLMCSRD